MNEDSKGIWARPFLSNVGILCLAELNPRALNWLGQDLIRSTSQSVPLPVRSCFLPLNYNKCFFFPPLSSWTPNSVPMSPSWRASSDNTCDSFAEWSVSHHKRTCQKSHSCFSLVYSDVLRLGEWQVRSSRNWAKNLSFSLPLSQSSSNSSAHLSVSTFTTYPDSIHVSLSLSTACTLYYRSTP